MPGFTCPMFMCSTCPAIDVADFNASSAGIPYSTIISISRAFSP